MAIIVSGRLHVDPAQRDAYLADRVAIVAHARAAPGCVDFSLSPDILDPGRINVHEHWRSEDAVRAYRCGGGPELDDRVPPTGAVVELHEISATRAP